MNRGSCCGFTSLATAEDAGRHCQSLTENIRGGLNSGITGLWFLFLFAKNRNHIVKIHDFSGLAVLPKIGTIDMALPLSGLDYGMASIAPSTGRPYFHYLSNESFDFT